MKVLDTGTGGELGRALFELASASATIFAVDKSDCDMADPAAIAALVHNAAPSHTHLRTNLWHMLRAEKYLG